MVFRAVLPSGGTTPGSSDRKAALRRAHQAYAAEALRLSGLTQKGLAEAAGFDRTVLSRLFSERHDNVLSPIVIEKIGALTGQTPPGGGSFAPTTFYGGAAPEPRPAPRRDLTEATPFAANDDVDLEAVVTAIIGRRNECDPWAVATDALAIVGLRRGDIVFVDRAARPVDGDLVLVQLYNWDDSWAGSVLRILDRNRLVLPWTGPSSPAPIDVGGPSGGKVAIMGPVTQTFRPRRMSQIECGEG